MIIQPPPHFRMLITGHTSQMLMHNFFVVGLTGGLASGKSLASHFFSGKGISVIDADVIVRNLYQDPIIQQTIQQQFGSIDRNALRELIFRDAKAKNWLEQLLHPLVFQEISNWHLPPSSPYGVLVAPLLIEAGLHQQVDKVLVIDCDHQQQIARAAHRDQMSEALTSLIIAQQMHREARLLHADHIIVNNGTVDQFSTQIDLLHQYYLRLAQQVYPEGI